MPMSFAVPLLAVVLLCLLLLAGYGEVVSGIKHSNMLLRVRNHGPESCTYCGDGRGRRLLCLYNDDEFRGECGDARYTVRASRARPAGTDDGHERRGTER